MGLRKRGNSYQIDYFDPDGKRIRMNFKKKKDAQVELGKRISLIAEGRYLDVKKDYITTLRELLSKYEENHKNQRSFQGGKDYYLKNFREHFGEDTRLANIRYVDLETYRNHLREKPTRRGTIRATASVNREIACLRHVLSKAVEWEMMEQNPFTKGKALVVKANNKRFRYLMEDEIQILLDNCVNKYTNDIVTAVINSGMRRQEVLSLKWDQVRNSFIYLTKTKTDEARQIPINDDLSELFKDIRKRNQLKFDYVFCDSSGRPFKQITKSFQASLRKAGIKDFKFHDLRHTFASHFVMRKGSLKDLQEILGHKTLTMTLRYAHLSQEHKKKSINLLNGLTSKKRNRKEGEHKEVQDN